MRSLYQPRSGLLLAVAMGLSLTACHQGPATTNAATASATDRLADDASRQRSGDTVHPINPVTAAVQTKSFASLMRALPSKEQVRVSDWYERTGGPPMDNATPTQIAWMQARHYPMPADIARAASMSEAELKAAAGTGDTTAQILYVARLLDEYSAYVSAGTPMTPARYRDPNFIRLGDEISRMMRQILPSGSPYAGYLFAAKDRLMHPDIESNAATQLAGLVWASKFGDTRANRLLNTPTMQVVDAATAGSAIALMLNEAIYANPTLFSAPVVPLPPSNQ